jgi:transcriptional regulator with XRE-family HTH domain
MNNLAIGRRVRDLRTKMGVTGKVLAKKVGLTQAQISRLENGVQGFRAGTLTRIARALGVPPIYFYLEDPEVQVAELLAELRAQGVKSSRALRKALAHPAFLRFAERCAESFKREKKSLERMDGAVRRAIGRSR